MATSRRKRALLIWPVAVALIAIAAVASYTVFTLWPGRTVSGTARISGGETPASAPASPGTESPHALPAGLGPGAHHVHMGDSYAAGTGEPDLVPDAPRRCQRTKNNPGARVARELGWDFHDVSCTSATTEHLTVAQHDSLLPQADALDEDTDVVTVVLGANDGAFFGQLVSVCADLGEVDPSGSPCREQYGEELTATLETVTGPNLKAAYREIHSAAPNARIFAIGYPWLLPESGACRPAMRFADGDIAFGREIQALLNEKAEEAVESVGGTFVDMSALSDGHDACASEDVRWIEPAFDAETGRGMGVPGNHPNARGQQAMAGALEAAIRDQG